MIESYGLNRSDESESDISTEVTPTLVIDGYKRVSGPTRRSTKGGWTPEEDKLLSNAVLRYQGKNWKRIVDSIPEFKDKRTLIQCQHRWLKVLHPNLHKGPWRKEEDDLLSELVKGYLANDKPQWSKISKQLDGRIGKQCRERWHNHLNPTIKKTPWTREEELILIQAQRGHGNKWAEIAKLLHGRTENNIKNHWNCSVKKRLDQFSGSLSFGVASGFEPSPTEYNFLKQSNTMSEIFRPCQIKESMKSLLQRDSLDLTLGSMNWTDTLRGEEETISSSVEYSSDDKAEISHLMLSTIDPNSNILTTPCSEKVSVSIETPQSSNDDSAYLQEVKEKIREKLRRAASTFNTPSIISKRSSPASGLKRLSREKDDTNGRSHLSSVNEHSISASLSSKHKHVQRNTSVGSKPLERRLDFDFM